MKKTFIYVAVLVGLALGTYFLIQNQSKSTVASEESAFAVENTGKIDKIFLADKKGNKATLFKENGVWKYRNPQGKEYKARATAVDLLLKTIEDIKIRYVVPEAAMKMAVNDLSINGVKVELYDGKTRPFKTYYVGGPSNDQQGTFMIMEGSDQPYVTHLGHWEGVLTPRFMLLEKDWRDKTVFAYDSDNITSVSVDYPKQQSNSFKITRISGGKFEVEPLYPSTIKMGKAVIQPKVEAYLYNFEKLIAENFENGNPNLQEISQRVPFAIVSVTNTKNEQKTVSFIPIIEDVQSDKDGNLIRPKVQRYFAFINGNEDVVLVQDLIFRKIFWGYAGFFE